MTSYLKGIWTRGRRSIKRVAWRVDPGLLAVLVLPVFVAMPLLQPGLPRTADGYLHLLRVVELDQCWRDGVLYPRWAPDMAFGYGYPIFNYFAPLLYLLTEFVHVVGPGFESSFKLVLIGSFLLSGWGMYALGKDTLGARAGVLAAAAYIYAPFMLREVFVRGGYAQFLALSIMPAALWSFHRLATTDHPVYLTTSPVLCGAVILSHNISGMLFFPFVMLFVLWAAASSRRWSRIKHCALALVLSLSVIAFFLIPALAEKPLVKLDRLTQDYFDFSNHFLTLEEILSPSEVPDNSSLNPVWLLNLGFAQVILGPLGVLGIALGSLARYQKALASFFILMLLVSTFMTLPLSTPLWEYVPLLAFTEFPWRFLSTAILGAGMLAGVSVALWSRLPWRRVGLAIVTLSLALTVTASFVHLYTQWPPTVRDDLSARDVVAHEKRTGILGTTSASECLPTSVVEEPKSSPLVEQYLSGGAISKLDADALPDSAHAEPVSHTVVSDRYRVIAAEPVTVRFFTFAYPGWQAFVDGEPVPIAPSYPEGLITFEVPAGEHDVLVSFGDTPVRTAANLISVGTVMVLVGVTVWLSLRTRRRVGTRVAEPAGGRTSLADAGVLGLAVVGLLLIKVWFIDPHTTWFRKSSPPGQVLGVQHAERINVSDEVLFLGYDLSSESVTAGQGLRVTLYWEAQQRLQEDYSVFLHLDDLRSNYISWSLSEELSPADIPTSSWTPGFYVSDPHVLSVSSETPPGVYVLRAGLYRSDTGERLPVLDEDGDPVSESIDLRRVRVRGVQPVSLAEVTRLGPLSFGDRISLVGYKLANTTAKPGNYFRLLLYWEAAEEMGEEYAVFVHLVDGRGETWAQGDGVPANGIYPTWAWVAGEVVEDEHLIPLGTDIPPGTYRLSIGLYDLNTLSRLVTTDAEGTSLGDSTVLPTTLEVASP
jgi:hypothetical protein